MQKEFVDKSISEFKQFQRSQIVASSNKLDDSISNIENQSPNRPSNSHSQAPSHLNKSLMATEKKMGPLNYTKIENNQQQSPPSVTGIQSMVQNLKLSKEDNNSPEIY